MNPLNSRWPIIGGVAVIVLTQIACTAWIARHVEAPRPTDNSAMFAGITEQLASIESAVGEVQDTADGLQARTTALTDSMGNVARACAFR
jgi:hypothetical protein